MGLANWLLGIKITRDFEVWMISLSWLSYIGSMLTQFNSMDLKPFSTPMNSSIHFSKDQCPQTLEEATEMSKAPYWEAVGSLNYCAVATWPDIAFPVSLLAQFMENPRHIHWEAVKRIFHYLLRTRNWELTYGTTDNSLKGYADADGSSQEHRHAISGCVFSWMEVQFHGHLRNRNLLHYLQPYSNTWLQPVLQKRPCSLDKI